MRPRVARRLQRWSGALLGALVALLTANSAFLATTVTPQGLVPAMQRLHLWLGAGLCVVLLAFGLSHVSTHRRHRNERARRIGWSVLLVAGLGCTAGIALWLAGRGRLGRAVVLMHEAAFGLALGAYVLHRVRARATPALRLERLAAVAALLLVAGIWLAQLTWPRETPINPASIDRPQLVPGLSQARTVDGHVLGPEDLDQPDYCAQCHPAIAARWESSTHRHSSLNDPFYAATLALSQTHRSPDELKFCGGCHDPLLLLTGRMDEHPRPDSPAADAGITCLACHAITQTPDRLGNGSYVVAAPQHYPGKDSDDPDERENSQRLIRSKPAQHIESFGPEHLRTSELCLPCHKAHIPGALNNYRWLRGQNEYDAWHQSGAGGHSARTFYPPLSEQKRCQDCHMPKIAADDPAAKDGKVADHAFLGANTALPHALGDDDWQQRNDAFLRDVVSVDIAAAALSSPERSGLDRASPEKSGPAPTERLLAPPPSIAIPAGSTVTFDVVVRNQGSGHMFPAGIADLREAWLELTLVDTSGQVSLASGWLDPDANLDPDAHRWNTVLLDKDSAPLRFHEVEEAQVVLTTRRIMLGASDVVRVALTMPDADAQLQVRVLHRKFPRDYVRFVLGDDAPRMPSTVLAQTTMQLRPGPWSASPAEATAEAGARLRNLGIGHLLRGDTMLAREAATAASERLVEDPGPHLDLARIALDDGALDDAEQHVRAADRLAPGHPTAAWLLARIRAGQGNHPAALAALDVALAKFPRDRVLLVMKGDSLFRLEREDEARVVLEQALQIDPELVGAHALLARLYAEREDEEAAQRHQQAWDRLRPRSEDAVLAEKARRSDPALDRRANQQYLLELAPVADGWTRAVEWSDRAR